MTVLFQGKNLSKSFGTRNLFTDLSFSIFAQDRIGLIGPNGSGKSTLLKMIAGIEKQDAGELSAPRGLKIGYVPQTAFFEDRMAEEILLEAIAQDSILQDYEKEVLVQTYLSKFGLAEHKVYASQLSGGWKKRLSLAKELIKSPDLLLLDEPTNHLDLESILWLEKFLKKEAPTYLLVSHDRYFLQQTANKIIEIDATYPHGIFSVNASYTEFLSLKEEFLKGQLETERSLASKARKETEWLATSPKARTCKSKSRVRDAHELLEELSDVKQRNQKKKAGIDFVSSERETQKLIVAKNLAKTINGTPLFRHLDFTLFPGTRMGLMGLNGSGKTTLLRLLAKESLPDEGTLKMADDLKIVYFDQHRTQLPDTLTLKEALSPNGDFVLYHKKPIHVNGWCKRFLFSPDLLHMPIAKLSGGERARIAIAHLMLQEADILLLDEPTNDLDIQTLEILEESLLEFSGAVVLITHDRYMLDRVCNLFLALGDLECTNLYATYSQWESNLPKSIPPLAPKIEVQQKTPQKGKLSYKEQKEKEGIELSLSALEKEVQTLNRLLEDPLTAGSPAKLQEVCTHLALKETQIEQLYLRFFELDSRQ